jgi:AhpD family alkylhydroperoxidase
MALAIAIAIRCAGCTLHHVNAATKHGASRQEAVETITVAIEMGDEPAVDGATARAMFDEGQRSMTSIAREIATADHIAKRLIDC